MKQLNINEAINDREYYVIHGRTVDITYRRFH